MSIGLVRLTLSDFRNYAALSWKPASRLVVLHGSNGSGKTNLLEAISLLVPGRGLRGARMADLARRGEGASGTWTVAGRFATTEGDLDIGTAMSSERPGERRVFRLDGETPRNQAEIAARVSAVWLTPQMDRLFQEGAAGRRRFLDRLVLAIDPGHAREAAAHDSAMAQRNRLLTDGRADPAWVAGLEDAMARHAVAVTAARLSLTARLNEALAHGAAAPFPVARLTLSGPIVERLESGPALAAEDWVRDALAAARPRDAAAGSAAVGAHRADMGLADAQTGLPAAQASTGQQKALLIGVILGHAALLAEVRGFAPLLLLDEPTVHLDASRRAALFAALARLPAQAVLTGTDRETFRPLHGIAEALRVADGGLHPDADLFASRPDGGGKTGGSSL